MTLQELLLNLLGTHTRRKLKVVAKGWEGELLIKGDEIVMAEVHDGVELAGMDALRFMFDDQKSIERIEFQPYENGESNIKVDQMDLFTLIEGGEETSEFTPEEVALEWSLDLEEKVEAKQTPGKFLEVCKKYFRLNNLKLVYCKGNLEFSSLSSPEEALNLIDNLVQKVKDEEPCAVQKLLIRFSKVFCLILISNGRFGAVAVDVDEYPNYELDQPFIDGELSEALST